MARAIKDQRLELLDQDAFTPFHIVMTSGHEHEVRNPHLVDIGESEIDVYGQRSDKHVIIRFNQIAAFHVAQVA